MNQGMPVRRRSIIDASKSDPQDARRSQFVHQVAHLHLQGFGDFQHGSQRNLHVPALDLADEIVVQIGLLRQFLLRKASLLAVAANFVAQHAPMKWFRWHPLSRNQKARQATTHYTVHFTCAPFGKRLENHTMPVVIGNNLCATS